MGRLVTSLSAVILLVVTTQSMAQAAAPKPGTACKKSGLTQKSNGVVYICKRSGKKLVWTVAPSAKKSPSPSATPSPAKLPVTWSWNEHQWVPTGTPPACTFPIVPEGALLDFSKVLSVLQPGQVRGGSYKPHGGLRWSAFGTYTPDVKISVPFDGFVQGAWQYLSDGVYQFGVNIENSCGFMVRLGHLFVPSAQFAQILKKIPAAMEGDSRETYFASPIPIKRGDVIATQVGNPNPVPEDAYGAYIDFGLLDLRQVNPILPLGFSSNAAVYYAKYSVCWYQGEYLSVADREVVAKLPLANGDPKSDYCSSR